MKKAEYIKVLIKAGYKRSEIQGHKISELKAIYENVKGAELGKVEETEVDLSVGQIAAESLGITTAAQNFTVEKPSFEDTPKLETEKDKSIELMKGLLADGYSLKLCATKRYITISGHLATTILDWIKEHKPYEVIAMKCGEPARHFNV